MKRKDWLIAMLAPIPVLLIPLLGNLYVEGWKWSPDSFVFAWVILVGATLIYRLLATSPAVNLAYRLAAGLAVLAGFLIFWFTAAVQIIGDENPANLFYLGAIVVGLGGAALARLRPAGLANAAFATATTTMLVPVIAFIFWPSDFRPGVGKVFTLNGLFALMFIISALLFRRANRPAAAARGTAGQPHGMSR